MYSQNIQRTLKYILQNRGFAALLFHKRTLIPSLLNTISVPQCPISVTLKWHVHTRFNPVWRKKKFIFAFYPSVSLLHVLKISRFRSSMYSYGDVPIPDCDALNILTSRTHTSDCRVGLLISLRVSPNYNWILLLTIIVWNHLSKSLESHI